MIPNQAARVKLNYGLPAIETIDGQILQVDQSGFVSRRREPGEPPSRRQIELAINFFELAIEAGAIQKTFTVTSYRLKHAAERMVADYISNGAAILGAVEAGVPVQRTRWDDLNAIFPISRAWYRLFAGEIQGSGLRLFSERTEESR